MRKIEIDKHARILADAYSHDVTKLNYTQLFDFEADINNGRIEWLSKKVNATKAKEYVKLIVSKIRELPTIQPNDYDLIIREFEGIIKSETLGRLELKYQYGGKKIKKSFSGWIIDNMHYTKVRSKLFPHYVRELGIKTCVYCNSQYAITTKNGIATYELDHCWPKSRYPYLCTNFFNLQPCCSSCNKNKYVDDKKKTDYSFFSIWKKSEDDNKLFGYQIKDSSLAKYYLESHQEDIEIDYDKTGTGEDYEKFLHLFDEKMKIKKIYSEHKDIAEEILWKIKTYNPSYIESLRNAFEINFGGEDNNWLRFFFGTYMNPDECYKRPLSELIQDIVHQLVPLDGKD